MVTYRPDQNSTRVVFVNDVCIHIVYERACRITQSTCLPPYISSVFKMASTWRYTLVCLDGVMDISTTD